ncbi:MAG: hypothetical protein M3Y80_00785, partial [Verrucomicrobiota bacterium]|nr:hypothetical protein [Verrucomicrobiota bacterium]
MSRSSALLVTTTFLICAGVIQAQTPSPSPAPAELAAEAQAGIVVTGSAVATPHPHDDFRPKLEHIMKEGEGTQITVTKKASVIKLDQQPPIENNNLQEQFTKAPGL